MKIDHVKSHKIVPRLVIDFQNQPLIGIDFIDWSGRVCIKILPFQMWRHTLYEVPLHLKRKVRPAQLC